MRDRCCQNNRGRFEGGLDSGNALPRVRRFRLSGKKPAKEPAVKKRSDATCGAFRKGEHRGDGENLTLPIPLLRCARSPAQAHRLSEDGHVFPLAKSVLRTYGQTHGLRKDYEQKCGCGHIRFVARPIVFAVASDERILRDTDHGGGTLPLTHGEKTTAFAEN